MSLKTWSAVLLVVVALGVLVQSLGDPVVPLGSAVIFLVAAAVTGFVPGRWAAIAALLASVFLCAVTVVVGSVEYLVVVREPLQTVGLWIQVLAAVGALICASAVLSRRGTARDGQVEAVRAVEEH
jgi:hypothetical protein